MPKSIYLVNPAADSPTYFSAEVYSAWAGRPAASLADLAVATVAGMAPSDFALRICDENISPIDFDSGADYVGLTGKVSQWGRMRAVADEFRRRGKTVLIGGPFASLSPEVVEPHCDILVQGEMEEIAEELFSDLRASSWKRRYVGNRPSLALSPPARWDLYPNHRSRAGTIQTSRGCPFECDFCDVIQYLGRRQRHKAAAQVLAELDDLCQYGYRGVFLADDNFSVNRNHAKELLSALSAWNGRRSDGKVYFGTQMSVDAARDGQLLRLCAEAGLAMVFIGLETPNEDSLREARKPQNVGIDLVEQVQRFTRHGILVFGGMVVGFDQDGLDIFRRQYEFAMSAAIPVVSLGSLVAPAATPLYDRLLSEDRLILNGSVTAANPWDTNIVPMRMSREELFAGVRWLSNKLYHPSAFGQRTVATLQRLGRPGALRRPWWRQHARARPVDRDNWKVLSKLAALGRAEALMVFRVLKCVAGRPWTADYAFNCLLHYAQVRYMLERGGIWNPRISARTSPFS